jgi:hypothetical protein
MPDRAAAQGAKGEAGLLLGPRSDGASYSADDRTLVERIARWRNGGVSWPKLVPVQQRCSRRGVYRC